MRDAELDRRLDRPPHALHALAMAFDARQATLGRPAAVAVHDDGDMARGRSVGVAPIRLIHRKRHVRLRVQGKGGSTAARLDLHDLGFLGGKGLVDLLDDLIGQVLHLG